MTAIHAIFDGKNFVPKQAVSLAPQSEVILLISNNALAQRKLDAETRAYYMAGDAEDAAWEDATSPKLKSAWDED